MGSRSGFDADLEFDEIQTPVDRGSGALSIQQRQANALTNLGLNQGTPASTGTGQTTVGNLPIQLSLLNSTGTLNAMVDVEHYTVQGTGYTLSNVSTAQQAFNGSATGAVTLGAGNMYFFEAQYLIANTGTTSHTWSVLFGGTATFTSIAYSILSLSGTTQNAVAGSALFGNANAATAVVVTAASTSATEFVTIILKGFMVINAAGTVIPEVKLSTATGTAATMGVGSYMRIWKLLGAGPVGAWT